MVDKPAIAHQRQADAASRALETELVDRLKAVRPELSKVAIITLPHGRMFRGIHTFVPMADAHRKGQIPVTGVMLGSKMAELFNQILKDDRFEPLRGGVEMMVLHEYGHSATVDDAFDSGTTLKIGGKDVRVEWGGSELLAQQYALAKLQNPVDAMASTLVIDAAFHTAHGDRDPRIEINSGMLKKEFINTMARHWSMAGAKTVTLTTEGVRTVFMELEFKQNKATVREDGSIEMEVEAKPHAVFYSAMHGPSKPKRGDHMYDKVSMDPKLFAQSGVPQFVPITNDTQDAVVALAMKKWDTVAKQLLKEARAEIARDSEAAALAAEIEESRKAEEGLIKKIIGRLRRHGGDDTAALRRDA